MLAVAGCIKPRPTTTPAVSLPLDVPPPPPHVIAPPEPEPAPDDATPAATEEPAGKDKPRGARPRPQGQRPPPEAAKPPEPKPEAVPPPAEVAKPPATEPSAALQPALQESAQQQLKKQVEAQLAQARKDLDKVNVPGLNAEARTQYDAAKQFIAQANTALKDGNLVFAQKLAEKAVGLATNLLPR